MSSLSWKVDAAPSFVAGLQNFQEKKTGLLRHIAGSERLVDVRPASRLEVRPRPEMLSSGVPAIDALTGGFPRGCLTEIWGAASSGKSSVLLAAIAAATRREETCVLIDASDSFDPVSAGKAGVDFGRLLWVRCGESPAVGARSATDRERMHEQLKTQDLSRSYRNQKQRNERRLEQVLKSTDLVLQSGGFGLVALDLAGIPEKFVRRIPLASWFRFQRAVEHTKTVLLVISESPCAQTCASLVVKLERRLSAISSWAQEKPAHAQVLDGLRVEAEVVRSRLERKPMQSIRAAFETQAVRAG